MDTQKVMGVDYGEARVGLAVSFGTLAEPLGILLMDDDIYTNIQTAVKDNKVTALVVGVSDRQMAQKSTEFANKLQDFLGLPVELFDESFSTQRVWQKLKESKKSSKYRLVDHLAAAEILQDWLDR